MGANQNVPQGLGVDYAGHTGTLRLNSVLLSNEKILVAPQWWRRSTGLRDGRGQITAHAVSVIDTCSAVASRCDAKASKRKVMQ